jgi:subtilisin-like proprotein convertase family protein
MSKLTKYLFLFLILSLFSTLVSAGVKEDLLIRLSELSNSIKSLKSGTDLASLEQALTEYQSISNQLGGDQASTNAGGISAPNQISTAPTAPDNTTISSASFSDAPGLAITTGAPVAATIAVTTTDTYLWDIDLTVNITHTFASDLDFTLTSPAGSTIVISTDNGGGNDDVFAGTLFDDDAIDIDVNNSVNDFTYTNSVTATPLAIESAFAGLIGEDPNGTWTLDLADDAGGDDGVFIDWSLNIFTLDQAPINDPVVSGSSAPALAITTGAPIADTITIVSPNIFVCDVNMTTSITHTFASDLDFTLTSPAGTIAAISTDNGGGFDDVFNGTLWDDSALISANDFAHANAITSTPLVPEASMGAFIGEDPNGVWTINIADDAGGDDGSLASWSLDITTCAGMALNSSVITPSLADLSTIDIVAPGGTAEIVFANSGGTDGTLDSCTLTTGVNFSITAPAVFPATIAAGGDVTVTILGLSEGTDTLNCSFTDSTGTTNVSFNLLGNPPAIIPILNNWTLLFLIVLIMAIGLTRKRIKFN